MTHGSLFSGIGGFDLGFERAGFKTIWQVEIDPYCRKVLEKNFPHARRFDDIHDVVRWHHLDWVDVISGGFPCQDISNAGKRTGIDGERSGLWSEMWRVIRAMAPRFVVVENVAALLGRGMERVLGDLASGGYDAEWDVLPACAFGAPHIRERIFIVAYAPSERCGRWTEEARWQARLFSPGSRCGDHVADTASARRDGPARKEQHIFRSSLLSARSSDSSAMAYANSESLGRIAESWSQFDHWAVEPDVGRVADGVPNRVERLKGLGNAVVPQIAQWIAERIKEIA